MPNLSSLPRLGNRIEEILLEYLKVESFTNTKGEEDVDAFFHKTVGDMSYFKDHPDLFGQYETDDPLFDRKVNYAFYKGSKKTYVMIHHSDVVNVDNYAGYKDLAFEPNKLMEAYKNDETFLGEEAISDLKSNKYLFGRGVADMKAGGAIELALLDHYSSTNFEDSILVIAVPDEENESLGMRAAISLLKSLKDEHNLEYELMINTEPHQRMDDTRGVISQGSIGKLNVFVHVKGVLAHAGKALEGINSNGILASIVRDIDLSQVLVNETEHEMSIPPSWVMMRDTKKIYDISFPNMSYGILNVLNFTDSPSEVLSKVKDMTLKSLNDYIDHVNAMRQRFSKKTNRTWSDFPSTSKVFTLGEYLNKEAVDGDLSNYPEDIEKIMISSNDDEPLVIIGILPPYYPAITNKDQSQLLDLVNEFTQNEYEQGYDNRMYFTGISDLSYSSLPSKDIEDEMKDILGWGSKYTIPFEDLKHVQMPCVNIGPWGKDFHKPSERVYKEDVFERTPNIIDYVIRNYKGGFYV
ncbi:M20/M25/M40 family metallo-hydrolase [Acidaminobacter sp. JC074]|uniref:M20/M25/M40 family metallo-hydrolase n=1 Tax=Acidaminobacter sp. JC074 TaxID=2530199 RepID=UPI001F102B3D|nr:M20/M25/M40 family metallo-hydrolase [Acidaminobacter sp. JC074]MCH4886412.1 M20/M25/M40 family metallo-hydrolase [Acidaminobacter sp. JC074]